MGACNEERATVDETRTRSSGSLTSIVEYTCPSCKETVWSWRLFHGAICVRCATGSTALEDRYAPLFRQISEGVEQMPSMEEVRKHVSSLPWHDIWALSRNYMDRWLQVRGVLLETEPTARDNDGQSSDLSDCDSSESEDVVEIQFDATSNKLTFDGAEFSACNTRQTTSFNDEMKEDRMGETIYNFEYSLDQLEAEEEEQASMGKLANVVFRNAETDNDFLVIHSGDKNHVDDESTRYVQTEERAIALLLELESQCTDNGACLVLRVTE